MFLILISSKDLPAAVGVRAIKVVPGRAAGVCRAVVGVRAATRGVVKIASGESKAKTTLISQH